MGPTEDSAYMNSNAYLAIFTSFLLGIVHCHFNQLCYIKYYPVSSHKRKKKYTFTSINVSGLGDSCFNTQVYSILGSVYKEDSAPAFAIFKFVQSTSAAIAFFYSNHMELPYQLLILVIFCVGGTISFCAVEWKAHRMSLLKRREEDSPENVDTACGVLPEGHEEEETHIIHDNDDVQDAVA